MRLRIHAAIVISFLLLAGCAGSVAPPTSVEALPSVQTAPIHVGDVTADADPGVLVGDNDYANVIALVKADPQSQPQVLLMNDGSGGTIRIHFTRFDRGNAFARAMLAGLGQIHINATVFVTDSSGKQLGEYNISKDFFLGGIYGATTTVADVEVGFAKSVAAIFQKSTA